MSSSARRALRILKLVGQAEQPLGVSDIARAVKSPPATAFRALDALARAGLVARYQASARYVLGAMAERLRQSEIAQFRIREICLPFLHQLASASGETASLFVRLGWYSVRIASVPGAGEIAHVPPLGESAMLGKTYSGKAILAFLPQAEIARYRAWSQRHKSPAPKSSELAAIAEHGFALGEREFAGGAAVAFPLRAFGGVAASLAVEGPGLPHGAAEKDRLREWQDIAHAIEALSRGPLFGNPFAHIDPDSIVLAGDQQP